MIQRKLVLSAFTKQNNAVIKHPLNCFITVEETVDPYSLIFFITTKIPTAAAIVNQQKSNSKNTILKMEVFEDDLSKEINDWLNGKEILHACYSVNAKVEYNMTLFMKSGKTPPQLDLILWILSRSEIQLPHQRNGHHQQGKRSNNDDDEWDNEKASIIFGGIFTSNDNVDEDIDEMENEQENDDNFDDNELNISDLINNSNNHNNSGNNQIHSITDYLKLNTQNVSSLKQALSGNSVSSINNIPVMMSKTMPSVVPQKQLHLQTNTLSQTTATGNTGVTNPHTTALIQQGVKELQQCDKEIRQTLEQHRVALEIENVRRTQHQEKYNKIRLHHTVMGTSGTGTSGRANSNSAITTGATSNMNTTTTKAHEVKLQNDIMKNHQLHELLQLEVKKQKARSQREHQKYVWSKAPLAFSNLRGQSTKGAYLGQGPLPPTALTSTSGVSVTASTALMKENNNTLSSSSSSFRSNKSTQGDGEVEQEEETNDVALLAIKKALANVQAYKLDIKQAFDHVCSTGTTNHHNNQNPNNNDDDDDDDNSYYCEGIVPMSKLPHLFRSLGLRLDRDTVEALYRYFDPDYDNTNNHSSSSSSNNNNQEIHREDFLWAFFNRKKLQLQYKQTLKKYANTNQVENKFRVAYKTAKYNHSIRHNNNHNNSNGDDDGNGYNNDDDDESNGFVKLTKSEYIKLLKSLHLQLTEAESDILFDHFDVADDHLFDVSNFHYFLNHMNDFTYILNVSGKVHETNGQTDNDVDDGRNRRSVRIKKTKSSSSPAAGVGVGVESLKVNKSRDDGDFHNHKNHNNSNSRSVDSRKVNNNNSSANSRSRSSSSSPTPTAIKAAEKRRSINDNNDDDYDDDGIIGRISSSGRSGESRSGVAASSHGMKTKSNKSLTGDKKSSISRHHDNDDDDDDTANTSPAHGSSSHSLYKAWMARLLTTQHEIEERLKIKHYYLNDDDDYDYNDNDNNNKSRNNNNGRKRNDNYGNDRMAKNKSTDTSPLHHHHFLQHPPGIEVDDDVDANLSSQARLKYISKLGYDPSSSSSSSSLSAQLMLNSPTYRAHSDKTNASAIAATTTAAVTPRYLAPLPLSLSTHYSN